MSTQQNIFWILNKQDDLNRYPKHGIVNQADPNNPLVGANCYSQPIFYAFIGDSVLFNFFSFEPANIPINDVIVDNARRQKMQILKAKLLEIDQIQPQAVNVNQVIGLFGDLAPPHDGGLLVEFLDRIVRGLNIPDFTSYFELDLR